MTKRWASLTPDNFRFTAKFPRYITHEKRLADPDDKQLEYFFDVLRPLHNKTLALVATSTIFDCERGLEETRGIYSNAQPRSQIRN